MYAIKDGQFRARFFYVFRERKFPFTLLNRPLFWKLVLNNSQQKSQIWLEMIVTTAF